MNIQGLLKINSMKNSTLLAGMDSITNEIKSVNILEAVDIENWGSEGQAILTSYFALKDLDNVQLESFMKKLKNIGISVLIIKIDRLLEKVPAQIIDFSNKYSIPLIKIDKDIKYEYIILEILEPIVDKNISLLKVYYKVHSELTNIALDLPSIDDVLNKIKKMINYDLSLINKIKKSEIGTNSDLNRFTILDTIPIKKKKYMFYKYSKKNVIYNIKGKKINGNQITVTIPSVEANEYELIIHERNNLLTDKDFMIIENTVKFLQMELLKKYALSQKKSIKKNNIISDLLNGRVYQEREIEEVLEYLNISRFKYYRLYQVKLYDTSKQKILNFEKIIKRIIFQFRFYFNGIIYLEKINRVVFISNFNEKEIVSIDLIKKVIDILIDSGMLKNIDYNISISSKVTRNEIPQAKKEILATEKVLNLFYDKNTILNYDNLGIYRLFLKFNTLDDLKDYISPNIISFKNEFYELYKTLSIFLDNNQNYVSTSKELFLHPKSIRYRIKKSKEILNIDLNNSEEIINFQLAVRIFKLIEY